MRKTSHDGIDATSITSGIENEIKKAGTKIKKTSLKRKVQNLTHESDEGIIEPLLQIDKERSEISHKSAKYCLNKIKTDSSFEKVNKGSENFAMSAYSESTPDNSANKISNTIKDISQLSSPYICSTAPLHNHMNTNIFGMYDVSKGIITTKNSILVEIDGSKSGGYSPSPLIFTTAKIHTDSKSKFMEPVQITPVPILSTIEGNVVRTLPDNSVHHMTSLSTKAGLNINNSGKSAMIESQSMERKPVFATTITSVSSNKELPNSFLNEKGNKNMQEFQTINSDKDSTSAFNKNQNISQLSIKTSKSEILPTSNYSLSKAVKDEICIDSSTIIKSSNDSVPITSEPIMESAGASIKGTLFTQNSMTTDQSINNGFNNEHKAVKPNMQFPPDMHLSENKSKSLKSPKGISGMEEIVTSATNFSPMATDLQNQDISKTFKLPDSSNEAANTVKVSSSGSKRLQRQKNAAIEEINEIANTSYTLAHKSNKSHEMDQKNITKTENQFFNKDDCKTEDIPSSEKKSAIITTAKTATAIYSPLSIVSKPLTGTISKREIKSATDVENQRPLTCSNVEDSTKILNKPSSVIPICNVKDHIKSLYGTVSTGHTSPVASCSKLDTNNPSPTSTKDDLLGKCETSVVTTTLPSYIVSTSRTKIGSTLTFSTITSTTKSLTPKSLDDVVYTTNGTEKKPTTSGQGNKSKVGMPSSLTRNSKMSKQTKSKPDSNVKDGRA